MLCPQLCLIQDRQFRIPNYPIKMLIISYLDKPLSGTERVASLPRSASACRDHHRLSAVLASGWRILPFQGLCIPKPLPGTSPPLPPARLRHRYPGIVQGRSSWQTRLRRRCEARALEGVAAAATPGASEQEPCPAGRCGPSPCHCGPETLEPSESESVHGLQAPTQIQRVP